MSPDSILPRLGPHASDRLVTLASTVVEAGLLARSSLKRRYSSQMVSKAPRDYQTEVDVAVEQIIVDRMKAAFPKYSITGEEQVGNVEAGADAPRIYIDPIDGTTNYAWGLPHFGIVISIVERGEVVCGVVYDCMLDELFSAEKGKGAYLNGERLALTPFSDVQDALIGAGLPVPGQVKTISEEAYQAALRRLMDNTAGVRRLGSAALSTAYVACGRLDGFFEDGLSMHDYGASMLIVREAGGVVTGFLGGAIGSFGDLLVANPALHPWLVEGFQSA